MTTSRACTALLFWFLLLVAGCSEKKLSLRFDPPDAVEFSGEVHILRQLTIAGIAQTSTIELSTANKLERTSDGYSLTSTPTDVTRSADDSALMSDNLNIQLPDLTSILFMARDGRAHRIVGTVEPSLSLMAEFPGTGLSGLDAESISGALCRERLDRWNRLFFPLVDHPVLPEQYSYRYSAPDTTMNSPQPLFSAFKVADTLTLDDRLCARVIIWTSNELDSLAGLIHVDAAEIERTLSETESDLPKPVRLPFARSRFIDMVLEIETMLVRRERIISKISGYMTGESGDIQPVTLTETTSKRYTY